MMLGNTYRIAVREQFKSEWKFTDINTTGYPVGTMTFYLVYVTKLF